MDRVELVPEQEAKGFHGKNRVRLEKMALKRALTFCRMRGYLAGLELHDF
jgi:hypothetical protein